MHQDRLADIDSSDISRDVADFLVPWGPPSQLIPMGRIFSKIRLSISRFTRLLKQTFLGENCAVDAAAVFEVKTFMLLFNGWKLPLSRFSP
jgi:hypothetical protein